MAQSKKMMKSKKNARGLKNGKRVEAVKTLTTGTTSPTLFINCAQGKHFPTSSI